VLRVSRLGARRNLCELGHRLAITNELSGFAIEKVRQMNANPPPTEQPSPEPHHPSAAWLSLLIPIVVFAVAFIGEGTRLFGGFSDGFLVLIWLFACGVGGVIAIGRMTKSTRANVVISILALVLNIAVALGTVFFYAMSHLWEGVKG